MTVKKGLLPKTRFVLVHAPREEVDRMIDQLIKENAKTLALLARS